MKPEFYAQFAYLDQSDPAIAHFNYLPKPLICETTESAMWHLMRVNALIHTEQRQVHYGELTGHFELRFYHHICLAIRLPLRWNATGPTQEQREMMEQRSQTTLKFEPHFIQFDDKARFFKIGCTHDRMYTMTAAECRQRKLEQPANNFRVSRCPDCGLVTGVDSSG